MKRGLGAVTMSVAILAAALLGLAAAGASAATTFGRDCKADGEFAGSRTLIELLGGTTGLPVSGVITTWKLNVSGSPTLTQRLKVERSVAGSEPTIVAESAAELIPTAAAGVPTRLPVQAGDLIGLSSQGPGGVVFTCEGRAGDVIYFSSGDVAVGEVPFVTSSYPKTALPLQVTIEPDADGDGFGDETQDACPANPLLQSCPTLAPPTPVPSPSPTPPPTPHPLAVAVVHKGSVTVKVTSDIAATVAVASRVALGGGATVTPSGGKKAIAAGGTASLTLKFPKALTTKLTELPAKRKLTLRATVTATSPAGPIGTARLTLKLPGRG